MSLPCNPATLFLCIPQTKPPTQPSTINLTIMELSVQDILNLLAIACAGFWLAVGTWKLLDR